MNSKIFKNMYRDLKAYGIDSFAVYASQDGAYKKVYGDDISEDNLKAYACYQRCKCKSNPKGLIEDRRYVRRLVVKLDNTDYAYEYILIASCTEWSALSTALDIKKVVSIIATTANQDKNELWG